MDVARHALDGDVRIDVNSCEADEFKTKEEQGLNLGSRESHLLRSRSQGCRTAWSVLAGKRKGT